MILENISPTLLSCAQVASASSGYQLSNLQMQKILYISQVLYMGSHGKQRLMETDWQAWKYGPVAVDLYRHLYQYRKDVIPFGFYDKVAVEPLGTECEKFITSIVSKLSNKGIGYLVDLTHHPRGAWAEYYEDNQQVIIPDEALLREYKDVYSANEIGG